MLLETQDRKGFVRANKPISGWRISQISVVGYRIFYSYLRHLKGLPPKPVFRRADIRASEESSGWIFRDVTDESGRISLPIGRNREESGDGRSGRTGPCPPPLSSLFQPMGREMRPRRHGKSIRRIPPEGGYPPDTRRIPGGYPPDIRPLEIGFCPQEAGKDSEWVDSESVSLAPTE